MSDRSEGAETAYHGSLERRRPVGKRAGSNDGLSREATVLEQAERHVREGEERIARQKQLVAELERDGHVTLAAEAHQLLVTLEDTQRLSREHLEMERGKEAAGSRSTEASAGGDRSCTGKGT